MISIIVPVYNGEKYINNCAAALMSQSHKNIEIIFVNDGSQDNTQSLLDEIKASDPRVKVIHTENSGVSTARNSGIKESSGEYIMFCDIDDVPKENWCEELFTCIEKFPGKLPLCAAEKVFISDAAENFLFTLSAEKYTDEYTHLAKKDIVTLDDTGMLYSLWNKIFSAEIIKENDLLFLRINLKRRRRLICSQLPLQNPR